MCVGGSRAVRVKEPEYKNRPVTVTGEQIGVENPIDTAKVTEQLKIQRQKKEGTYVDPNLTTAKKLTKSGSGNKTKQQKANLAKNRQKAKDAAKARMKSKFKSSPTGRKTGVA